MLLGFFSGRVEVSLPSTYSAIAGSLDPTDCRADYIIQANGDYGRRINNSGTTQGALEGDAPWANPKGLLLPANQDFEYNITKTSGTTPSGDSVHGNTSTWTSIPASGELGWYFTRTSGATITCELELQIREIADTSNIDTCTVTLTAQQII